MKKALKVDFSLSCRQQRAEARTGMEIRCPHTEHLSTHAEAGDAGGVHHRHQRNHRRRRMEEKHGNAGRRRQTRRDHHTSHAREPQATT
eukprot:707334-Hanusia_phi.AAC.1